MFTDKRGKFICIRWKYCSAAITPFLYAIYSCIKLCHACSCSFIISLCSKNLLHPNKVLHIQSKSFDSLLQTFLANCNLSFRSLLVSTHFFVSISSFQSCPSRNSANCFCNNCTNSMYEYFFHTKVSHFFLQHCRLTQNIPHLSVLNFYWSSLILFSLVRN